MLLFPLSSAVIILWYHNVNMFADFSTRSKVHTSAAKDCLPVRTGAIHICIPKESESIFNRANSSSNRSILANSSPSQSATPANIIKSMIVLSIGAILLPKLRFHTGD